MIKYESAPLDGMASENRPRSSREARAVGIASIAAGFTLVASGQPVAFVPGIVVYLVGLLATRHAGLLADGT